MASGIIKFLEGIFPFLFSALRRAYDNLSTDQQQALVNSGMIGQLLKNNLTILGNDLVTLIAKQTGLTEQQISDTLIHLAGQLGLNTTSVNDAVAFLQNKLTSVASNSEWNGILTIILNVGATFLSGGSLDWVHIAIGIGEWVYQHFIQPIPVTQLVAPAIAPMQTQAATTDPNAKATA